MRRGSPVHRSTGLSGWLSIRIAPSASNPAAGNAITASSGGENLKKWFQSGIPTRLATPSEEPMMTSSRIRSSTGRSHFSTLRPRQSPAAASTAQTGMTGRM